MPTVGVVSPGAMGSALVAAYADGGARVVATLAGRSERTARLARAAPIELLSSLDDVVAAADVLLSVVPPGEAFGVAQAVADAARRTAARPLVADLNAVSPATMSRLAATLADGGLDLVDGAISGPPPTRPGTTRVYLAGPRGAELAALPAPALDLRLVGSELGAASAVKMCTASVYKGTVALLTHALLTARANGVLEHVLDDLRESYPQLVERAHVSVPRAAAKAGRYVAEMEEIAAAQADAGLTPSLFAGMAEAYAALARAPLAQRAPEDVDGRLPLVDALDGLAPRG